MRYHNITKDDMLNGDGLRVVLWVAGCNHCCKECQNPITWDPNGGLAFTEAEENEIFAEPVSYTHLDVYKRQAWKLPCFFMRQKLRPLRFP